MFFFLPTGSTSETSRRPLVTIVLAALCVALFGWTSLEQQPPPEITFAEATAFATDRPWLIEDDYAGPLPAAEVLAAERKEFEVLLVRGLDRQGGAERRFSLVPAHGFAQIGWLTNLFVHFDLFHLLGNMLFLWLVGPLLEEAWGRRRFLAFYLCAGLVASLVQFLISRGSPASIGGASGAIAGCMGAFALRFAMTKIRFHYFLWFIRIFVGSVHVPAWICGALWFGRELWDLKDGGVSGVATGAHVGGFVLGGVVALGMRALGSEKALLTVAESAEERARLAGLFADATAAMARGDAELGREQLLSLQRESPDHPGLALLLAEADALTQRGLARLERVLRPLLAKKEGRELEQTLARLWPSIDPKGFSQSFAWKLAERLRGGSPDLVEGLLQAVAGGTGALAIKARAELASRPGRDEGNAREPEVGATLELPSERVEQDDLGSPSVLPERSREASLDQAAPRPAARVLPVTLVAATREGLQLDVEGTQRLVPFARLLGVHGGLVAEHGRRALWVDLVLKPDLALRLSGEDPVVAGLFPGKSVPEAWQGFIGAVRRAAGVQAGDPPWRDFTSLEALTQTWSP